MHLFAVALRNIFRNKRRSAISALAILVGVGVIVFLRGFFAGFMDSVIADTVEAKVGAIQVFHKGFLTAQTNPLKLDLPQGGDLEKKLASLPGVTAVAPRISFEGMLSNGSTSTMFMATAVDPAAEYKVCPKRRENVMKGSTPLESNTTSEALVGAAIAKALDVKAGGSLTMLSATREGPSNALDVTVKGFLPSRFISESKRLATVPLGYAQSLLRMEGRVTVYVLRLAEYREGLEATAAQVKAAVGDDFEVDTWRELAPQVKDMEVRLPYTIGFVTLILFLLVFTGIANTMLMSVLERTREIGTMMAVGVRRRQIMVLFLVEGGALGLVGGLLGAIAGTAIVLWLGKSGVMLHPPGGDPNMMFPRADLPFAGWAVLFAVVGAVVSALYPAWKASRLRPVEALRAV